MTRNGTHPGETLAAAPALAGGGDRYEVSFRLGDLPDIRRIARAYGVGAGLGGGREQAFGELHHRNPGARLEREGSAGADNEIPAMLSQTLSRDRASLKKSFKC